MNKQTNVVLRFLKLAFNEYKPYFFVLIFHTIVQTLQTIFGAYIISLIIDSLEKNTYNETIKFAVIFVGVELILLLLAQFSNRLLEIHKSKMEEAIDHMISRKILSLPFAYLEDPYYLELKKNAAQGVNNMGAVYLLLDGVAQICSSVITIISLSVIIITFDVILLVVLFVGIILFALVIMMSMRSQIKFFKDLLPINYKYGYYLDTLYETKNNKELRMYNIYDEMYGNFQEYGKITCRYLTKYMVKNSMYQNLISIIRYVQMGIVYTLIGIKTITDKLPISNFSLTVSAAISFSTCITNILNASSHYLRSIEYIKPVLELMSIDDNQNSGTNKLEEINKIEFKNVTFKYPKTDKIILDNISFVINSKEKISIVGLNGAGKTTIVKLLCKLYEPNSGEILINDIPINNYENESYINKISAVFQDYKLFAYSIKDNVSVSSSLEEVKDICSKTGVDSVIEKLENKYDSILLKSYDEKGIELSGGQQQKIAISRALAKNADLLILDEPTSALDPLAEAEIYENFNSLVNNKIAIYISHRMSSSIFCDKILVIDNGKVSDYDTHENLLKNEDSLYTKLFNLQAINYKLD